MYGTTARYQNRSAASMASCITSHSKLKTLGAKVTDLPNHREALKRQRRIELYNRCSSSDLLVSILSAPYATAANYWHPSLREPEPRGIGSINLNGAMFPIAHEDNRIAAHLYISLTQSVLS